eukprot:scaffold542_cov496-Prasinococcus_capsulatus_cf.AAC.1
MLPYAGFALLTRDPTEPVQGLVWPEERRMARQVHWLGETTTNTPQCLFNTTESLLRTLPIGVPRGLLPTGDTSSGGEARPVWGGGAAIDGSGTVVGASTSTSPFGSRGATLSFIVLTSCSLWFTRFFSRSTASSSFRSCSFISRFLRAFSSLRRFFSALRASSAFSVAVVSMVPPSLCVTSSAAPFVAPPGTTTVPPAGPSSSEALRFNLDNSSSARSGAFAPPAAPPPGRLTPHALEAASCRRPACVVAWLQLCTRASGPGRLLRGLSHCARARAPTPPRRGSGGPGATPPPLCGAPGPSGGGASAGPFCKATTYSTNRSDITRSVASGWPRPVPKSCCTGRGVPSRAPPAQASAACRRTRRRLCLRAQQDGRANDPALSAASPAAARRAIRPGALHAGAGGGHTRAGANRRRAGAAIPPAGRSATAGAADADGAGDGPRLQRRAAPRRGGSKAQDTEVLGGGGREQQQRQQQRQQQQQQAAPPRGAGRPVGWPVGCVGGWDRRLGVWEGASVAGPQQPRPLACPRPPGCGRG